MEKEEKRNGLTFAEWRAKVNDLFIARLGIGIDDLPDYCYWDCWDCDESPEECCANYAEMKKHVNKATAIRALDELIANYKAGKGTLLDVTRCPICKECGYDCNQCIYATEEIAVITHSERNDCFAWHDDQGNLVEIPNWESKIPARLEMLYKVREAIHKLPASKLRRGI